jgi:hypothetical protein
MYLGSERCREAYMEFLRTDVLGVPQETDDHWTLCFAVCQ